MLCVLVTGALSCAAVQPPVSVVDFGARPDGTADATAAFKQAIVAVAEGGGTVRVPPGRFLLAGSITIPEGVTLRGSWEGPHHGAWRKGSTLLVTGSRGNEKGPAAIEMSQSTAVRGFTVVYPEQKLEDIKPYPWTIHGTGMHCTVENVTLVNSYNGIAMGPQHHELHLIRNVFGCVLRRGVLIDNCTDIGRVENVHFNPHYWVRAQFPGSPGVWRVKKPDGNVEVRHPQWYMVQHLEAFIFGRTDWEYVLNTFVFGAKIGYHFVKTPSGAPNGNFLGLGADWCDTCVQVDATQPMGLLVTNGEFVGNRSCASAIVINDGVLLLSNSNFWGYQHRNLRVTGPRCVASLSQCLFRESGPIPAGAAVIEASGGMLSVQGCMFLRNRPHITIGETVRSAVVFGNTFAAPPRIENRAKGDVKIDLNVTQKPVANEPKKRPRKAPPRTS